MIMWILGIFAVSSVFISWAAIAMAAREERRMEEEEESH
jgi:hypothetical protein